MPASNGPLNDELRAFFSGRFGVSSEFASCLRFRARGDEIWAATHEPPAKLSLRRPPGLLAARRTPAGLQPEGAFLAALGRRIICSRIDLTHEQLRTSALGQRIPIDHADGFYAVCCDGDVFGAADIRDARLQLLLSPGHRSELLRALDRDVRPQ